MSTSDSSVSPTRRSTPSRGAATEEQPDSHGRFSLSEDWVATIAGLAFLALALLGLLPDIGEWFG